MLLKQYQCPDCGGFEAYRSRRRNLLEKYILPFMMLQPARCMNCHRRTRRFNLQTFVGAREQTLNPRTSGRLIVCRVVREGFPQLLASRVPAILNAIRPAGA